MFKIHSSSVIVSNTAHCNLKCKKSTLKSIKQIRNLKVFSVVGESSWLTQVLHISHDKSSLWGSGWTTRAVPQALRAAWERKLIPLWEKITLTDSTAEAGCNFAAVAPPPPVPPQPPKAAEAAQRRKRHLRWVSVKLFYCLHYKLRLLAG